MAIKSRMIFLAAMAPLLAACSKSGKEGAMPSLSGLVSLENEVGVGVIRSFKGDKNLVFDFESPSFGEWVVIVAKGEAEKKLPDLALYSCGNAGGAPPVVMTMDAYAEAIKKEPAPAPGQGHLPGEKYASVDERLAGMRKDLKSHPALVYRYCKKYPPAPAVK